MTVKAILRGYTDTESRQAIYIRVSEGSKRTYKRTRIKIKVDQWENGEVINHPQHKLYNQILRKEIYEAETLSLAPVNKFPAVDFYKYYAQCVASWKHTKASETIRQHTSEINTIKSFSPTLNLSFTTEWLNRYKAHLFAKGNTSNTVHKHLKFVRLVIRKAHRERLIEQNPFDIFEMPKYRDAIKKYLSKEQVERIEKFAFDTSKPKELTFTAAWFVIGVYTGFRFSDLKAFSKSNIRDGRIIIYTAKTGEVVSMPFSDKIKALFELINYQALNYTNVHYNRMLKNVGVLCDITHPINAHQSRHSATMIWANAGISQEVVAKLLGHSSLKSTAVYYKISGQRIDEELKKVST